jgi:hypothetical protein
MQAKQDLIERSIRDRVEQNFLAVRNQELTDAYHRGMLAIEQGKLAVMRAKASDAGKGKEKELVNIGDVERKKVQVVGGDGKPVMGSDGQPLVVEMPKMNWQFDPEDKEGLKEGRKARQAWAKYSSRWENVVRLREQAQNDLATKGILGKAGFMAPDSWDALARMSPAVQQYEGAFKEFLREQLRDESGLTVTDQEVKDKAKQYPTLRWIQSGDGVQSFINMREQKRSDFEDAMETYSYQPEGQPLSQVHKTASPAIAQDYSNSVNGIEGGVASDLDTEAARAISGGGDYIKGVPHKAWQTFQAQQNPEDPKHPERVNRYSGTDTGGVQSEREWTQHMDAMARMAISPEEAAKHTQSDPEALAKEALHRLENMGRDPSMLPERRAYADFLSSQIIFDPDGLLHDLDTKVDDPEDLKFH